jgi:hypothetical protein
MASTRIPSERELVEEAIKEADGNLNKAQEIAMKKHWISIRHRNATREFWEEVKRQGGSIAEESAREGYIRAQEAVCITANAAAELADLAERSGGTVINVESVYPYVSMSLDDLREEWNRKCHELHRAGMDYRDAVELWKEAKQVAVKRKRDMEIAKERHADLKEKVDRIEAELECRRPKKRARKSVIE